MLVFNYIRLMKLFTSDTGMWPDLRLYLFYMIQKVSSVCIEAVVSLEFFLFDECWKFTV